MSRNDNQAKAVKAQQLLEDETLIAAFSALEAGIVKQMKGANTNGTPESVDFVMELARKLQTVEGVKKALWATINNQKLTTKPE